MRETCNSDFTPHIRIRAFKRKMQIELGRLRVSAGAHKSVLLMNLSNRGYHFPGDITLQQETPCSRFKGFPDDERMFVIGNNQNLRVLCGLNDERRCLKSV